MIGFDLVNDGGDKKSNTLDNNKKRVIVSPTNLDNDSASKKWKGTFGSNLQRRYLLDHAAQQKRMRSVNM